MQNLYLIDASVYVFRAWFSFDERLVDAAGEPINAVVGYTQFLCELLERRRPVFIAAAFDESLRSSFRHVIDPDYKANRPSPPESLKRQFRRCRAVTEALGIPGFASGEFEADDLIGSLAERFRAAERPVVVVSSDKDLAQLLVGEDRWWDAANGRWLDCKGVEEKFGVAPAQIADLLALAGDAVDNIPGVPGIGRKTAAVLLQYLHDLDGIYRDLARVEQLPVRGARRIRRLLEEHRAAAFHARRLTRIHCGAELDCGLAELAWRGVRPERLRDAGLPSALERRALRLVEAGITAA